MTMTNECAHDFRCILNHEHPSVGQHECIRDCVVCGACEFHGARNCGKCLNIAANDRVWNEIAQRGLRTLDGEE